MQLSPQDQDTNTSTYRDKDNIYMVVPYSKGLSESFKHVCRNPGVQAHFMGGMCPALHCVGACAHLIGKYCPSSGAFFPFHWIPNGTNFPTIF